MDAFSTPRTFCLSAGTYNVNVTIVVEGDTVIGAGRDATFIDGSGLDPNHSRIFYDRGSQGVATFRGFDISGARSPSSAGTCINQVGQQGNAACGKAFVAFGQGTVLRNIDCHDNGSNCVSGSSDLVLDSVNCYMNGGPYSMTSGFAHAACVKQAAVYDAGANDVTIMNSYIHDQPGNGIWCDFCKFGHWDIHDNIFQHNGNHAIQWEMSGGWSSTDSAHVYNNTFIDNGWQTDKFRPGGVIISTANDILFENNVFQGLNTWGISVIYTASRNPPQPDSRGVVIRNNTMNGDTITGCDLAGVSCS
jgi:hypothetical protein